MSNLFTQLQAEQERQHKLVENHRTVYDTSGRKASSPAKPAPSSTAVHSAAPSKPKTSPKKARKRPPTHASVDARTHARMCERVGKSVSRRRRLGSFTFRYRGEELDRLDAMVEKVNRDREIKVSKNDIVRIALNWLLEDHDANAHASTLSQVLAHLRE